MDSGGFTHTDAPLPLASLRLLVPPVQLMTASMWRVVQTQEVTSYWKVAQFVSVVMDTVPELLMYKHRTQLILGLRARYILELCRNESVEPDVVLSYLDKIKSLHSSKMEEAEEEEDAAGRFLDLIQTLLQNPEERQEFFLEDFAAVYGAQYASDLHTLFWEFLCRLVQLLPVPDLEQTVSWLGAESSVLEDCVHSLSKPTDLKHLLRHHKQLGHLEQHVPPSSMGDSIISSLSARPPSRVSTSTDQFSRSESFQVLNVDSYTASFVDDVAVEIISVTDYPEVELGASTEIEVVVGEGCYEADTQIVLPEETTREEKVEMVSMDIIHPEVNEDKVSASSQLGVSVGRHDCPDCEKKFKFASSLIAHRVIHTGERPHRCDACGRRFSFRQSLDRHRHTHKPGRGETLPNRENGQEVVTCDNNDKEARGEAAEPVCLDRAGDGGDPDSGDPDCLPEPAGLAPEPVSAAKVRTSGRRRKPTMKIQVINVQKQTKRRREVAKTSPPRPKPLPFACAEHSYGSPAVKDGEEGSAASGSSAAFSCAKCSFHPSEEAPARQRVDSVQAKGDECLQLPDDRGGSYRCSDCDKSFKFQSLLKTHLLHSGEQPFACSQCGRRFSFKQSLERHKQMHRSGRKHECVICGEVFKTPAAQRDHQSSHMKDGEYLCSECGRTFAWKSALVRHLKTHSDDDDKSERSNKCPHCDLSFSCASYLSRHLRTHQKEKEHACNCGKSFAYRSALTAHQRIHQKDRPHTCAQCGKGFLYKGGLLSHMKIHSEDMPFMCSYCGKSFKRERNMKKHERCHTRENVFSCSQCDKSFVYKATLIRHELTHSGERPYLCSDCGKGFFSHAELLKHERFHTGHKPFQCPHCGKRFTQSCYLTIHLRYHTGARPYSCSECDKSFLSANRLKRHQRTHSGERPYLCVECGKGFRQSYNLKMHQRTHVMK